MRRAGLVVVTIMIAAGFAAVPAASQSPPADGDLRIERSFVLDEPWRSTQDATAQLFRETIGLPPAAAEYDVVVTATLELRTSSSDRVEVGASYHVESGAPHPPGLFPPGDFKMMSAAPKRPSTTTAVWSGTLAQTDDPVTFGLRAQAVDGPDRGRRAWASGRRVTVVVDIRPSES